MKSLIIVATLWFAATAIGQGTFDLVLNDGTALKNSRVVAIGKSSVTIVGPNGVQDISIERLSPETLSKAKDAVRASDDARREMSDAIATRQTERDKVIKKAEEEELAKQRATGPKPTWPASPSNNSPVPTAFVNPRAVTLEVQATSKIEGKITAKRSSGNNDTAHEKITTLTISYRCMGLSTRVPVDIEAKFLSMDPLSSKPDVYSTVHQADFIAANNQTLKLVSDPLERSTTFSTEGLTRVKTIAGDQPYGWIVTLRQEGRVIGMKESVHGLAEKFGDR